MMLFKEDLLGKVLDGTKTQTRRTHRNLLKVGKVYGIKCSYHEKSRGHILIIRRWQQRLGDITDEEIRKEGFADLEAFARRWEQINGTWDPNQAVTAYEFRLEGGGLV